MKFQGMLRILFTLLRKRKASAAELASDNGVSERSIYRYVEELIVSGVPIDIIRGRNGGYACRTHIDFRKIFSRRKSMRRRAMRSERSTSSCLTRQ